MERLHFFADESGNSGSNHLDPAQPYYALAGFLVRPENLEQANEVVRQALARTQRQELKGSSILRRPSGRRAILEIIREMGQCALPVASLIEKRFALGARMADEFLDYDYNPRAGVRFRADAGLARSAAQVLSELPEDVLELANRYVKDPSDQNGRRCCLAVGTALRAEGRGWLAHVVEGALEADDLSVEDAAGLSPNLAGFTNVMAKLQPLALATRRRVEMLHDEQVEFADTFRKYQAFAADPSKRAAFAMAQTATIYPLLENLETVAFATSHDAPLLQAADLLAASITRSLRRIDEGACEGDEAELAAVTLGGFVVEEASICFHYLGSVELFARILNQVLSRPDGSEREAGGTGSHLK